MSGDQNLIQRLEADIAELSPYDHPGRSITVTSQNRQLLRSWLIANGVDVNRATKASDGTLASAWKSPAYLATMEKQKWTSKWTSGGKSIDLDAADAANNLEAMLHANRLLSKRRYSRAWPASTNYMGRPQTPPAPTTRRCPLRLPRRPHSCGGQGPHEAHPRGQKRTKSLSP